MDEEARENISKLESQIEALSESAEWCRKIALAAKCAIVAGALWLATILFGLILPDGVGLMGSAILIIGGLVLAGSNATTAQQIAERIEAAEKLRAALIGQIDLRVVAERGRLLH